MLDGLEGRQKRCGKKLDPSLFLHEETLELTKLHCWSDLSDEEYRDRVAEMVQQVVERVVPKGLVGRSECKART